MGKIQMGISTFSNIEGCFPAFLGLSVSSFGTAEIDGKTFSFIAKESLMAAFREKFPLGFDEYDREYLHYSTSHKRQDEKKPTSPLDDLFPDNWCPYCLLLAA